MPNGDINSLSSEFGELQVSASTISLPLHQTSSDVLVQINKTIERNGESLNTILDQIKAYQSSKQRQYNELFEKPEKFTGRDLSLLPCFRRELEMYFNHNSDYFGSKLNKAQRDQNRRNALVCYTSDLAKRWVCGYLDRWEKIPSFLTWNAICNAFQDAFSEVDDVRDHSEDYIQLKMSRKIGGAREYIDAFNILYVKKEPGILGRDNHYIEKFINGLTGKMQEALNKFGYKRDNLHEVQKAVLVQDWKWGARK